VIDPIVVPDQAESLRRVILDLVMEASPKAKRALLFNVLSVVIAVGIAIADWMKHSAAPAPYLLVGLVCGILGLFVLSVSYVLHSVSQQSSVGCDRLTFFQMQSQILHRIFLALPLLALVAGLLMAVAIGLFVPVLATRPVFLIVVVLFSAYEVLAIRTVSHTSRFLYDYAQRQAEAAARAQAEAAEAQLAGLQAQMNPHFLFNALNTVASLVRTDASTAEATVENLADVLRRTLDRSRKTMTSVREEVDYVKAYLAIEQERWGDRLRVAWAVNDDTLPLALPTMTLQPLVENALKHGLGGRLEGGCLQIRTARRNGRLTVQVTDNGIGFAPHHRERTGLGNLRKRLATLFGDASSIRVERVPGGTGASVVIELPVTRTTG